MGEARRKAAEQVLGDVTLSAIQREQMAALMTNLNTARIVAEQFISYFAKEQGVNLQIYQFDSNRLVFVPTFAPPPVQEPEDGDTTSVEPEPERVPNGHAEL